MNSTSIKEMSPANFSFVMATGIVSVIFHKTEWFALSRLFLIIGLLGYVSLLVLFTTRFFLLRSEILKDFKNIQKMFKHLTFSAGTNALAVSLCLADYNISGLILGSIGVLSTIILTYTLFCALFFHIEASIQAISPFWLLLAIACNSSGIVITILWENQMLMSDGYLLLALSFWSFGVFIYLMLMTLNLYRMIFFSFNGNDMDPCYWTCMGAAAIAVVDGSQLILIDNSPLFFEFVKPFMQGMTLFLWGWGTAWMPILCLMEIWKVAYFKVPFHYQPSLWAMVFPLGMYTEATYLLSYSVQLDVLQQMVPIFLWITFSLWCLVAYMSRLNPFSTSKLSISIN